MDDDFNSHSAFESDTLEDVESELKEPDMYRVILHNDHYTTMEFVVEVIMKIFHKPVIEATQIMMDVHQKGRASVGVYPYDIASTKANQVTQMAKQKEFPLLCTIEKE
jgi:ATP-dependent Clp protease adaptor protein ClpS